MTIKTTVPHLVLDYDKNIRNSTSIPSEIQGNIHKEHDYLVPILMKNYPTEWKIICEVVDQGIEDGTMHFNDEDGTITVRQGS
jgi:hypothetical protein